MSTNRNLSRATWSAMMLASLAAPRTAFAQSSPIRIGTVTGDTYSEPLIADELGSFRKAGLDASVLLLSNGGAIAAAVAGGSLDVGIADPITVANAANRGLPLALFAGGGVYRSSAPTTVLCAAKTSTFQNAKSLEGQTVGLINLAGIGAASTKAWLTAGGADLSKVKIIEVPQPEMLALLDRGTIAIGLMTEPFYTSIKADVRLFAKPYDAISTEFCTSYWFTTRDWVAKNAAAAKRLTDVVYETARWANTHMDLSLPILAKSIKVSVDQLHGVTRSTFATKLDPVPLRAVLDVAVRFNAIERPIDAGSLIIKV